MKFKQFGSFSTSEIHVVPAQVCHFGSWLLLGCYFCIKNPLYMWSTTEFRLKDLPVQDVCNCSCLPIWAVMFVCLCACSLVCLSSVQIANANANVLVWEVQTEAKNVLYVLLRTKHILYPLQTHPKMLYACPSHCQQWTFFPTQSHIISIFT